MRSPFSGIYQGKWLCIGLVFIASSLSVLYFQNIYIYRGCPNLAADTRSNKRQDVAGYSNLDVSVTKCIWPPENDCRFHSQSEEDRALLIKHFLSPVVCNGTFVELGALDGVLFSNTKFFEDALGWKGVLIEANPDNFEKLKHNRPRSTNFFGAVCAEGKGHITLTFEDTNHRLATGGDASLMTDHYKQHYLSGKTKVLEVPCRSMESYLKEAKVTHVDLFSLDVEGAEYMVLQTMDWSIPVHVFLIEMGHKDDVAVEQLLASHGYNKAPYDISEFCLWGRNCANNKVFVLPGYTF